MSHSVASKGKSKSQSIAPLPAIPNDGFLSRKHAAAFAGVNVQIVDAAIKRGELKAYRIKGRDVKDKAGRLRPPQHLRRVVIAKQDVIQWLTANQV